MFRRAEDVTVRFRAHRWARSGRFVLTLGTRRYVLGKVPRRNASRTEDYQRSMPLSWGRYEGVRVWQFRGTFYLEDEGLDALQIRTLLTAHPLHRRARADRSQSIISQGYRRLERTEDSRPLTDVDRLDAPTSAALPQVA